MIITFAVLAAWLGSLIAGAALLWSARVWRSDDHPRCRRCGYDLFGVSVHHAECSECGAPLLLPLAILRGNRKRRIALAGLGASLVTLSLTPMAAVPAAWSKIGPPRAVAVATAAPNAGAAGAPALPGAVPQRAPAGPAALQSRNPQQEWNSRDAKVAAINTAGATASDRSFISLIEQVREAQGAAADAPVVALEPPHPSELLASLSVTAAATAPPRARVPDQSPAGDLDALLNGAAAGAGRRVAGALPASTVGSSIAQPHALLPRLHPQRLGRTIHERPADGGRIAPARIGHAPR